MQTVSWQKHDAIPILYGKEKLFKEAGERRAYRQRPHAESLPVLKVIERFWALSRSAIECWDTCDICRLPRIPMLPSPEEPRCCLAFPPRSRVSSPGSCQSHRGSACA